MPDSKLKIVRKALRALGRSSHPLPDKIELDMDAVARFAAGALGVSHMLRSPDEMVIFRARSASSRKGWETRRRRYATRLQTAP